MPRNERITCVELIEPALERAGWEWDAQLRIGPGRVNISGESFEVARRYMIRLQQRDFENAEMLANLAKVVKKTPQQFRDEFEYLVKPDKGKPGA